MKRKSNEGIEWLEVLSGNTCGFGKMDVEEEDCCCHEISHCCGVIGPSEDSTCLTRSIICKHLYLTSSNKHKLLLKGASSL